MRNFREFYERLCLRNWQKIFLKRSLVSRLFPSDDSQTTSVPGASVSSTPFMAPNYHDVLYKRNSSSSSGYESSDCGSNSFSYNDSVTEMDKQLARIRKAPSKIIDEKRRFIVLIDMSNFKPEDIEVLLEKGRLTVKASQELMIDSKTSIEKHFLRKFSIPEDVRDEFVATELDKSLIHCGGRCCIENEDVRGQNSACSKSRSSVNNHLKIKAAILSLLPSSFYCSKHYCYYHVHKNVCRKDQNHLFPIIVPI
ncbi:hypothetical protein L596_005045 [Steinernema carpocapsae]|uniref:SHSP domain-containing protein n=1 Tax=Steinernema carpocapsae TaxID=34508 RepID=A0A4U8UYT0_STECR|nr:hypothetical protein L596_005045 [Steinernema carpocapsae]